MSPPDSSSIGSGCLVSLPRSRLPLALRRDARTLLRGFLRGGSRRFRLRRRSPQRHLLSPQADHHFLHVQQRPHFLVVLDQGHLRPSHVDALAAAEQVAATGLLQEVLQLQLSHDVAMSDRRRAGVSFRIHLTQQRVSALYPQGGHQVLEQHPFVGIVGEGEENWQVHVAHFHLDLVQLGLRIVHWRIVERIVTGLFWI